MATAQPQKCSTWFTHRISILFIRPVWNVNDSKRGRLLVNFRQSETSKGRSDNFNSSDSRGVIAVSGVAGLALIRTLGNVSVG